MSVTGPGGVVPKEYGSAPGKAYVPGGTWVRIGGRPGQSAPGDLSEPSAFSVRICQRDPPNHGVVVELGDKPPTPSEGGGGWEEIPLPKRAAVLVWKGRGLMKQQMSVLIDGIQGDVSVIAPPVQTLMHFWRPEDAHDEPAVLRLISKGDAVLYQELEWVLTELQWGEAVARDDGTRIQQLLELTFTEHREDERLQTAAARKKHKHKAEVHIVKKDHESLGDIAKKHHYKPGGKALGKAQHPPIKDVRATHKGQKIHIPAH